METEIVTLYKQGHSAYKIMEILNISSKSLVYKILHKNKITRNYDECHVPIQRKRNFFKEINTEKKAYWLGFLYADGCVHSHNCGISLALHTKDAEHLELLKTSLNLTNKVQDVNGHNTKRLEFTDKQMHADLIKQGCVPNKSLILEPPKNVPERLIRHFIRGLFDGDGSIYIRKSPRIRCCFDISGSEKIISWVKQKLDISNKTTTNKKVPTCYRITTSKIKKVYNLYTYLYKDATIFLPRKKEIFKQACAVYQRKKIDNNRAKTEKASN
jgi:intein-encoded DNA endonuclease-like protein